MAFLPIVGALIVGSIGGGTLLSKIRYYFPFYFVGTVLSLVGSVFLYFSEVDTSIIKICGFSGMVGFGTGLYSQMGFTIIAGKVPPHRIGHAVSFISAAQVFGSAVAVGLGETIVVNLATSKLAEILPDTPPPILKGLIGGTSTSILSTLPDATRRGVIEAIVGSIDVAYIIGIAAGGIGVLCSLLLPHERLDSGPTVLCLEMWLTVDGYGGWRQVN